MAGCRWLDITHAILAGMRARTGFRAPTTDSTAIPVYHSLEIGFQGESGPAVPVFLVLGWAGDPSLPAESGQTGQKAATLGPSRSREERGTIRGQVTAQTGDKVLSGTDLAEVGTLPWLCSQAFATLAEVEAYARTNERLALSGSQHTEIWIDSVDSVRPMLAGARGLVVELDFSIGYTARI